MLINGTINFAEIRLPVLQLLHESRQTNMPKLRMLILQLFCAAKTSKMNTATLSIHFLP